MRRRAERPRLQEMMADMRVLAAELQRCYGTVGFLPTREDLRLANRCSSEYTRTARTLGYANTLGYKCCLHKTSAIFSDGEALVLQDPIRGFSLMQYEGVQMPGPF